MADPNNSILLVSEKHSLFCPHLSSLYFFFTPRRVFPFFYGPFEKNIPSSPPRGYPPLSLFKVSFVSFFFSERRIRQRGKQNNPRGKEHSRYNGRNVTRSPSVAASASPRCCCCCCTVIEALKAAAMEEREGEGERHCRKLFFFSPLSFFSESSLLLSPSQPPSRSEKVFCPFDKNSLDSSYGEGGRGGEDIVERSGGSWWRW